MEFAKQLQALAKHEKSEEMPEYPDYFRTFLKKNVTHSFPRIQALNLFKKGLKMHLEHISMTSFFSVFQVFKKIFFFKYTIDLIIINTSSETCSFQFSMNFTQRRLTRKTEPRSTCRSRMSRGEAVWSVIDRSRRTEGLPAADDSPRKKRTRRIVVQFEESTQDSCEFVEFPNCSCIAGLICKLSHRGDQQFLFHLWCLRERLSRMPTSDDPFGSYSMILRQCCENGWTCWIGKMDPVLLGSFAVDSFSSQHLVRKSQARTNVIYSTWRIRPKKSVALVVLRMAWCRAVGKEKYYFPPFLHQVQGSAWNEGNFVFNSFI